MNLFFGARHLCRFNFRSGSDFGRRSGINAALRFRGSKREWFWGILTPASSQPIIAAPMPLVMWSLPAAITDTSSAGW
jgi:hypothetical protein